MNSKLKLLAVSLALVLLTLGCGPDEAPAPDCSAGVLPSTNPIEFYLEARQDEPFAYEDTMVGSPYVFFNSKTEYDSYTWKVGTDPRTWTTRKFELQFQNYFGTVDIVLVGRRRPRPECQPNDTGIDSFKRRITILPRNSAPIFGRFMGNIIEAPSSQPFEIYVTNVDGFFISGIQNLPNGCTYTISGNEIRVPTTWMYAFRMKLPVATRPNDPCWYGDGSAELLADRRTIVVRFKNNPDGLGDRTLTFRGTRVP